MSSVEMPFFNPQDVPFFSLGVEQVNKDIPFKSTQGVFSANAQVAFYTDARGAQSRELISTSTIGSGLALTGNNVQGEEKTLTLTISGSMFTTVTSVSSVYAECSLFTDGDVEVIFGIVIK